MATSLSTDYVKLGTVLDKAALDYCMGPRRASYKANPNRKVSKRQIGGARGGEGPRHNAQEDRPTAMEIVSQARP